MAALQLSEYQSLVRGYLDESRAIASERYPNAEITRALNNGGMRIVRDAELYLFRNTATQNATTGDITPPADFMGNGSLTLVVSSTDKRHLPLVDVRVKQQEEPAWASVTAQYPTSAVMKITSSGVRVVLYPAPTATITNGLFWEYEAKPTAMSAASDTFAPLSAFEELQPVLLPAAALTDLLHLEAGTLDLQWKKWDALYWENIEKLRGYINGLFIDESTYGQ